MNSSPLPVGVVVPTLNVRPALPAHLEQMKTWLDLVEEVVVVDSFSNDGTFELFKSDLHHPKLTLLQRPRGLFQSWNQGIQHVTAKYTYFATIGDAISREGLQHLTETAEAFDSDLVLSRPEFFTPEGQRVTDCRWPIHQLFDSGKITKPVRLDPCHAFLLATLDIPQGLMGSAASNLHRTETMKRFPFPTDFGKECDTAWAAKYALETSISVTPRVFSRFILHTNPAAVLGDQMSNHIIRLLDLANSALEQTVATNPAKLNSAFCPPNLKELPGVLKLLHQYQSRYDSARRQKLPWSLNPSAWSARGSRNRYRAVVQKVRQTMLAQIDATA
jgi:glycosyltransferase involved in cell wall biosynthesis